MKLTVTSKWLKCNLGVVRIKGALAPKRWAGVWFGDIHVCDVLLDDWFAGSVRVTSTRHGGQDIARVLRNRYIKVSTGRII